ncbi:maleylpyruvate isomerase family mycothiol-dependent enzyme [Streptomyces sp. AJS327]|uniref:maleylpyruvate isomerase family mycothiol-dependent enzyme n=1 Tax=Streptomyces sp. AJS327 TaxID=2545265 RepID=UPI0015DF880A|nr:maleylpyruvate isomerase family mycothiol-dependent enzyme [Streptomyces sp. AJS327]MBA0053172.1 maleylpyruvate isomerase family mycothiol-dependent enzyme [Streptomyces sp. AJS327]
MTPRDPLLPGRLLRGERDTLIPQLRRVAPERFALRTACPGWTVRQVAAHCGAALTRIIQGRTGDGAFSPEANAADVAERDDWPLHAVLDELEAGFTEAGPAIAEGEPRLDAVALGEWVHAGDIREALGLPGAYGGSGTHIALSLLSVVSGERGSPLLYARLPNAEAPLALGAPVRGRSPAQLHADPATLLRLYTGRPLVGTRYELRGAYERELVIYG